MVTILHAVSTRELRCQLSEVLGRAMFGHERIGVVLNGKLAALVVGPDDLEFLDALEMAQDIASYRKVEEQDDGTRLVAEGRSRNAALSWLGWARSLESREKSRSDGRAMAHRQ